MNKVFTIFTLLIIIILIGQTNFSSSSSGTPPNGRTGAPGESNCSVSCHTGPQNPTTGSSNITFNFDGGGNSYLPGQTYNVSVTLTDPSKVRFGFSSTVLDASNQAVGNFVVTNTGNTSIGNSGGKQYMRHKSAGSTQTWSFQWQAPATGQGDVTFYIAAVAANSAGGNSGDHVYLNDFTINEGTNPSVSTIDFLVDKDSSCVSSEFMFTDNSQGNISSRTWNFGSDATPASASGPGPHSVSYSTNGAKTIELEINTADQGVLTKDTLIQVISQLSISVSNDTNLVLSNLSAGFTLPLSANGASSYSWSPNLALNNSQVSNPIFDPSLISFSGNDTQLVYTVTGTDSFGICSDDESVTIDLTKTDNTTGINTLGSKVVDVYPNPVSDFINIEFKEELSNVSLYNVAGKLLLSPDLSKSDKKIIINRRMEWGTGIYFLVLADSDGEVFTRKLIFE